MINKSKSLICGLAVLTAFGLVGCGTTKSSSSEASASASSSNSASASASASDSTSGDVVPLKDGFYTFYFHFKESDKVKKLESWTSPYIDGVFNSWNAHPGVEMKPVTGTDMYYAQISKDDVNWAKNAADLGYQLCLGYNSTSGVGESAQGIGGYTYKCDFAAEFSGVAHPVWATSGAAVPTSDAIELCTYTYGDDNHVWTAVKDHFMSFPKQPVEPIQLKNYTLRFEVDPALVAAMPIETGKTATYITGLSIKGSFNDWTATPLTKSDTDGSYSINVGTVIASSPLSFCIAPTTAAIRTVEDKYCLTGDYTPTDTNGYTGSKEADTIDETTKKITKVGNLTLSPIKLDGDDHTATWGMLKTYDGYTWPTAPVAMNNDVTITLTNSGTEAVPTDATLYVAGNFLAKTWGDAVGVAECALTKATDGKSYTFVIGKSYLFQGVLYEFGIITNSSWTGKLVMADSTGALTNFAFEAKDKYDKIDIVADWSKIGVTNSAGTLDYHGTFANGIIITLTNSGTAAVTGDPEPTLYVAGNFLAKTWGDAVGVAACAFTKGTDGSYTFNIPDNILNVGQECQFGIITNSNWTGKLVMADSTGALTNITFTAVAEKKHLNISADFAKIGVKDSAGVVEYVA